MTSEKDKRKEIFKNYKKSVKDAKFAPLNKYALNLGNPTDHSQNTADYTVISEDIDKVFYDYKIKALEDKLKMITMISYLSLFIALASIILLFYNL